MKKPTIDEWAQDCAKLGVQMRRYAYANTHLPNDAIQNEWNKTAAAIQSFANKYGTSYTRAEQIAKIISDSINLGVAY